MPSKAMHARPTLGCRRDLGELLIRLEGSGERRGQSGGDEGNTGRDLIDKTGKNGPLPAAALGEKGIPTGDGQGAAGAQAAPSIGFSILRILVLAVLVRQIMLASYAERLFLRTDAAAALCAQLGAGEAAHRAAAAAGEHRSCASSSPRRVLGELGVVLCPWCPTGTPCSTPLNGFLAAAVGFSLAVLLNRNERSGFDLSPLAIFPGHWWRFAFP